MWTISDVKALIFSARVNHRDSFATNYPGKSRFLAQNDNLLISFYRRKRAVADSGEPLLHPKCHRHFTICFLMPLTVFEIKVPEMSRRSSSELQISQGAIFNWHDFSIQVVGASFFWRSRKSHCPERPEVLLAFALGWACPKYPQTARYNFPYSQLLRASLTSLQHRRATSPHVL